MAGLSHLGRSGIALAILAAAVSPCAAATTKTPPKRTGGLVLDDLEHPPIALQDAMSADPVPSAAATRVLSWIATAHDNGSLPYLVVDKQSASLFLFDRSGMPMGQVPVLLGMGIGDDSTPGIGAKTLAEIGPAERTTPAGRFVAKFGLAFGHARVLWVDYADSVALHPVITTHKAEHRIERLLTPTADDNRITFGCINVAATFYARQIRPLFAKAGGVVYILPDTKSLDDVFPRLRLASYIAEGDAGGSGSVLVRAADAGATAKGRGNHVDAAARHPRVGSADGGSQPAHHPDARRELPR